MIVEKLSLWRIAGFFFGYLVLHIIIGLTCKNLEKQLEEKPDNKELQKNIKYFDILFKWFPTVWIIIILMNL